MSRFFADVICRKPSLSTKPTKRRIDFSQFVLPIVLFLSIVGTFPLFCSSLKSPGEPPLSSHRKNTGWTNYRYPSRDISLDSVAAREISPLFSSASSSDIPKQDDQVFPSEQLFPTHRPLLAIITETDACDTEERMKHTYATVKKAASTGKIDLVSVRLSLPPQYDVDGKNNSSYEQVLERASRLIKDLVHLSKKASKSRDGSEKKDNSAGLSRLRQSSCSFAVVCSSDLVSVAVLARADGIHVKEHHLDLLPKIVRQFDYPIVIGTSTHSVDSALRSYFGNHDSDDIAHKCDKDDGSANDHVIGLKPHYYFVGTCYLTASHPEKTLESQLEGPSLPGRVKQALLETFKSRQQLRISTKEISRDNLSSKAALQPRLPRIMAIGGIDETNCHEPVALGADGVAVIRAVLQADQPTERVEEMQSIMMKKYSERR